MQFNLCLSCGVPFLPVAEDYIDFDSVGNLSVLYFQKHVRRSEAVAANVENPVFSSKKCAAHIIHESHHAHALAFMSERREDADLREALPDTRDGVFPFVRAPKSKSKHETLGAFWASPDNTHRIKFDKLSKYLTKHDINEGYHLDFGQKCNCCRGCNMTMTMEFWFRYHLYNPDNLGGLIPQDVITVVKLRNVGSDHDPAWRFAANRDQYTFPSRPWSRARDAMAAAVAYYLHMCLPFNDSPVKSVPAKKALYQTLCWTLLEIACLISEYRIGPENNRDHKKRQCLKSHVGTIELYISYFCWRLYGSTMQELLDVNFETWHQMYFWDAAGCDKLFPGRRFGRLIVDEFGGNVTQMTSAALLEYVFERVWSIFRKLKPMARLLAGDYEHVPANVGLYFVMPANVDAIYTLARGAYEPSFDSFASCVGIHAMLGRLVDTCRDFDEETRALLASFVRSWRNAEIAAVAKAQYGGKESDRARVDYLLCGLLDPPKQYPGSRGELAEILKGHKCSAWAAVLPLHQMGAFSGRGDE